MNQPHWTNRENTNIYIHKHNIILEINEIVKVPSRTHYVNGVHCQHWLKCITH